jgi:hypothetical protein
MYLFMSTLNYHACNHNDWCQLVWVGLFIDTGMTPISQKVTSELIAAGGADSTVPPMETPGPNTLQDSQTKMHINPDVVVVYKRVS